MSGAMRKIGEYLGLLEDTGVYDDEYDEQGYAEPEDPRQSVRRTPVACQRPARQGAAGSRGRPLPAPTYDRVQLRRPASPSSR